MSARGAQDNSKVSSSVGATGRTNTRYIETARTRISKKWRNGERGAALVEAAIIFFPLCLILFGMIEYGFIFKDSLTISSATRSGARTASAAPKAGDSFFDGTVAAVEQGASALNMKHKDTLVIYKAATDGLPEGATAADNKKFICRSSCREYEWDAGSKKFNRVKLGIDWPPNLQKACLGDADSVGVAMNVSHDAISKFFTDLPLREKTVMRLEPLATDCS